MESNCVEAAAGQNKGRDYLSGSDVYASYAVILALKENESALVFTLRQNEQSVAAWQRVKIASMASVFFIGPSGNRGRCGIFEQANYQNTCLSHDIELPGKCYQTI